MKDIIKAAKKVRLEDLSMNIKAKSFLKISAVILVAAFLIYWMIFGLKIGKYNFLTAKESIKLGLDLQGGVSVLMEASPKPGEKVTNEKMEGAVEVINGRVDQLGVAEAMVVREGDNRIRVELPGIKDSQKALELIGKTASLEFVGPDEKVILTGKNVKDAKAVYGNASEVGQNQEPMVSLKLDSEGTKKFAEATKKFLDKPIAIILDGQVISAPKVNSVIDNGEAVIMGLENIEKAGELATLIRAGALPVDLKNRQIMQVGPTLGSESIAKSITAGKIGIVLILLFMLFKYKLPGLVADFVLGLYILIVFMVFNAIEATLTLPGIAGFILSVGMAVDANVLTFERIREELRNGKTLRAAVDSGFHQTLTTIIDSNVTTIIAAIVLIYFGTGPVKGFAVTLIIGILASMFTAVIITKLLLKNLINFDVLANKKLF